MLYHNQAAAQPPEQIYGLEGESVVEWTDFLSTLRQDSSNVALTSAAALRRKCSRRKEEREISIKTSLQDMMLLLHENVNVRIRFWRISNHEHHVGKNHLKEKKSRKPFYCAYPN